jgi:hypothetical protein
MESFRRCLFLREIRQQCQFAISDYEEITQAIHEGHNYKLFHSLQSFLIAAANISKIFWPIPDKYYLQRGQELRNLLSIDENNSPFKSRDPRNFFEHFDEKLDDWFRQSPHHNLIDMSMGHTDDSFKGFDNIRFFNTSAYTFKFRAETYEINPLYKAVNDLLTNVNSELDKSPTI